MMTASSSSSSLVNFTLASLVVVVVIIVVGGGQQCVGWPLGGAALYQCCCPDCRRECFSCRNNNYTCNCDSCSCYSGSQSEQPELEEAQTMIEKLLRSYSVQSRDRTKHRRRHPLATHMKPAKSHRHHGNDHSVPSEGQDANRTKKRLTPPVVDLDYQVNEKHQVT